MDSMGFVHDFALTENYMIFFQGPLNFNVMQMVLGLKPSIKCAAFDPEKTTQVIIVPRDGGSEIRLEAEPGFIFHFAKVLINF